MTTLEAFRNFTHNHPLPASRQALRQKFFELLRSTELPTRRDEDWKYFDFGPLKGRTFQPICFDPEPLSVEARRRIESHMVPGCATAVIWNGQWIEGLSDVRGLQAMSLAQALTDDSWQRFEMAMMETGKEFFEYQLDAFQYGGLCLRTQAGKSWERPLQILIGYDEGSEDSLSTIEIWLDLAKSSGATVFQSLVAQDKEAGKPAHLSASRCRARLAEGSRLNFYRLQALPRTDFHFSKSRFDLDGESHLEFVEIQTGARLSRQNVDVHLKGERASANVRGLYKLAGEQVGDHHTLIDHRVGACATIQHYKGILDDQAKGIFSGQVKIRHGSQKASSEQLNQNLLLSRGAEADSKPQLEIDADDVKATHGSAIGELADEELFYLRSRGIAPEAARQMLVRGYSDEIVGKIEVPEIHEFVRRMIE